MSKTPDSGTAVHPYLTAFQAFSENGAGKAPRWLKERRQSAIDRFVEMGFPTTRQEAWRFTDVKRLATTDFTLAGSSQTVGTRPYSLMDLSHHRSLRSISCARESRSAACAAPSPTNQMSWRGTWGDTRKMTPIRSLR
jgi:hypothetical protein